MFGKWDTIAEDAQGRPSCLWHDEGFMLVRLPLSLVEVVSEWILLRKMPYQKIAGIWGNILEKPFDPPIRWANQKIAQLTGTDTITGENLGYMPWN